MRAAGFVGVCAAVAAMAWSTEPSAGGAVKVPITCSKGPSGQSYDVSVKLPAEVAEGSQFVVRVDGVDSGKISQMGLNYVTDMTYEFQIPSNTAYVAGTAHVIAGTGSANVREGARISVNGSVVQMVLPAHVENGASYTPPSFELKLQAAAPAGSTIAWPFRQYRVTANAMIVGDVKAVCDPSPKPYTVASTKVVPAAQ